MSEKVVGTRMNEAVVEKLEALAVLRDRTVSQLVRMAVEAFLEAEERQLHPLSLEAAVSLGAALATETNILLENTSNLISTSQGSISGGVYLLVHPESRELYVGSSTELTNRLTHHKFSIKTGTHKNQSLNSWLVDEVVVVVLERCEGVKNAESKRALLVREQYYIDVLKLSKDWTLLNIADASTSKQQPSITTTLKNVNTPAVKTAVPTASNNDKEQIPSASATAFQQFYTAIIEQCLLPVLQEQSASRDVVRLFEGLDEKEQRWFLEFLHSYDSPWLNGLASSGRFPWVSRLMAAQV